jgi:FkbM family methyltransferase
MNIDKIKTLFMQFHFLNAMRILSGEVTRKLFDPYNITSYPQTGEDRILEAMLGESGFYIDVGCNHPQFYSNTFALYRKGWRGINIDANQGLIQKHQQIRKHDTNLCAVVSNIEQEAVFTEFEDSLVSSLDSEHVSQWRENRSVKQQHTATTQSLTSILNEHRVSCPIDLLCIDVEGHDFEVLCSLDLNRYRPKLIVIEIHGFDLNDPNSSKIHTYLNSHHYKMVGYVVMNAYFVDTLTNSN